MKTVAYSNPFVPPEWIAAHGLRPSVPRCRRHCRMRLGPADLEPRVGVARGVIHEVCPYARAFIRVVPSDPVACAVVITTTCYQMRHAAALIARDAARPVFLMNVPSTWQTTAAEELYLDELQRLGRFLVQLGGTAPSREDLARVMLEYESARTSLKNARPGMSARQFAEAIAAVGRCQESTSHSWRIAPPGRAGSGDPRRTDRVPLALLGGPLMDGDYALLDLIEQSGGRLVLDATEGGERTMPGEFDRRTIRDDPLRAMADAYFGTIPAVFRRPNGKLHEWLGRELVARQVHGVVLRRYVWCDLWHAELNRLKESSPVPVLDIDVCHDENGSLSRTAGRIEAFLEMLR